MVENISASRDTAEPDAWLPVNVWSMHLSILGDWSIWKYTASPHNFK